MCVLCACVRVRVCVCVGVPVSCVLPPLCAGVAAALRPVPCGGGRGGVAVPAGWPPPAAMAALAMPMALRGGAVAPPRVPVTGGAAGVALATC